MTISNVVDAPPPVTVLDSLTGKAITLRHEDAKSRIAMGSAIETVPSDANQAKAWVASLRNRVVEEDQQYCR